MAYRGNCRFKGKAENEVYGIKCMYEINLNSYFPIEARFMELLLLSDPINEVRTHSTITGHYPNLPFHARPLLPSGSSYFLPQPGNTS